MISITIYTTPTCAFCGITKDYLKSKNCEFEEIDLTKNIDAMSWILDHTGQMGVPVTKIGSKVVVGFDRLAIDESLKATKNQIDLVNN